MTRGIRRPALVVICIMLALTGFPVLTLAQGTTTTGGNQPGVSGNQYTSPTYGYSVSWDRSWQVKAATSKSGVDTLELSNGTSFLGLEGYKGGTPGVQGCRQDALNSLKQDSSVSNLTAAKGSDGQALAGGDQTAAYAVYDLTYTTQGGPRDLTEFLACYALPQQASLLVTDTVPAASYNNQTSVLQTLLGTIKIPSGAAAGNTSATAAAGSTLPTQPPSGPAASTAGTGANSGLTLPLPGATSATGTGATATSTSGGQTLPISLPGASTATTVPTASAAPQGTQGAVTGQAGVQGNHYTSPTYGYQLSWDATWKVTKAQSQNGDDYLELDNGTSSIGFEGATTQGATAQACVNQSKASYSSAKGVSNFENTTDSNGKPIAGSQGNDAWAVVDFTYTNSSGTATQLAIYIECYGLSRPNATLLITQIVPAAKYNDQINARAALLKTLTFPGGTTPGTAPATSAVQTPAASARPTSPGLVIPQLPAAGGSSTPSATGTKPATSSGGQAGVSGTTYTSPTYGYKLSWDSTWKVTKAQSANGTDLLQLDNGTSNITFVGSAAPSGGAQQCVTDSANQSRSTPGFGNYQPAQAQNGGNLAGGSGNDVWAVYDFVYTASDGSKTNTSEYIECKALPNNGMLLIDQLVASSDYNNQIAPRRKLLDALKLPGGTGTSTPGV